MIYKKAIISASIASWSGFLLGYDMGISGGTIEYVTKHFNLDSSWEGFTLSIFILGAILGTIFSRKINDDLGRKKSIIIGCTIMLIGSLGVYFLGDKFELLILFRCLSGAGMGLLSSSERSYVPEVSPPNIRGGLGTIFQLTTGLGIIMGYVVTFLIVKNVSLVQDDSILWKTIYGTEILVVGLYLISLFFMVNSPVWLLMKKRDDEAKKIMIDIWPDVDIVKIIEKQNKYSRNKDERKNIENQMKENGKLKKLMFIAFFMAALTELCGINPLIYYAPSIFRRIVPEGPNSAFYHSIINGVFFTIGSLVSMLTVDKFGRKKLLSIGTLLMALSLLIIGVHIYMDMYSIVLIYLVYLFIFSYNFSAGAIRFLYIGELAPTSLRASTVSFAGLVNWGSDFLVSWTLPIIANNIYLNRIFRDSSVFFLYSIFGFIFFLLIFTIPETKGKSLHEILEYWDIEVESNKK